jgi:hypothetical protein
LVGHVEWVGVLVGVLAGLMWVGFHEFFRRRELRKRRDRELRKKQDHN